MIQPFVDQFMAKKSEIRSKFTASHPADYKELIIAVVAALADPDTYGSPDPTRVHQIDDGNYQGTLLFIIADNTYQPDKYWAVKVGYGSCSGCDTLQDIQSYSHGPPTEQQLDDYMTLALHVVQGLKEIA